jgi:hypothetical protein
MLSGATSGLVGAPVTLTATASGEGTSPVYQYSVGPTGGSSHVVSNFSPSSTFTWNPMQEGSYTIQVTVKTSYSDTTSVSSTASYTANSRIVGTSAVVNSTSNPLIALYSVPPSTASSVYVQFSPNVANPTWLSTSTQTIVPGESTNIFVAGMLPNTTYLMRHVLSNGTTSAPLMFTTGSLPTSLTFPTFTVTQPPAAGADPTQNMVYHVGINTNAGVVDLLSTDLSGNINWYYDPVANNFPGYGPTLLPGGTILMLGGAGGVSGAGNAPSLREIDLAGDLLRETNINAVNAQLATMGKDPIINFNHDALRLPNGDTAVLAGTQRVINGTTYTADDVIVLDQNFQVAWVWDSLDFLDPNRMPPDGEGPGDFTHANSISWSPEDGNLLVSLRSQDWVVKINYNNGAGDGHIIWRLGAGGNFTINSTDPSPWFSHQHDAIYINDNTIVLFDDGNTRRLTNPNADSRGQELVLNEQTMTATLVVNADLGNYSFALGSAQVLPNGNLDFDSGILGSPIVGQSIEVSPDGTKQYVLQQNSLQYRSYFMSTLYQGQNFQYGLEDAGFEDPSQGTGTSAFQSDPTASAWTYNGTAGVAGNGSTITSGNPNAPQGTQVAFLQKTGIISQVVNFLATGTYQLSLLAAQRGNSGTSNEAFQVLVDGKVVTTFTPTSTSYATFTTPSFNLTAGSHTIAFVGVDPTAANYTALLDQVSLSLLSAGTATFLKTDTSTKGSWQGVYGSQGYNVIDNATSLPSYAQVSASGNSTFLWTNTTTDTRALQEVGSTNRIAAAWYSPTSFTVNVNLTDGQTHQLALYLLDWDGFGGGRNEQVEVLDAATGDVLNSQTVSNFGNGAYLVWNVSNNIQIKITNLNGSSNAVLNGLFLDPPGTSSPTPGKASFLKTDTTTKGSWQGVYGSQGYNVIDTAPSLPSYAQVSASGNSTFLWTNTTTDTRALQEVGSTNRIAAVWYSPTSFTVNVNLTDGQTHQLALYLLDWDGFGGGRNEQVQILDATTGNLLSGDSVSNFSNGEYLVWNVSGNIQIQITNFNPASNAVLNGLFLDPAGTPPPPPAPGQQSFVKTDTTTKGSWQGVYGSQGYNVIDNASSYPSYAQVSASGNSTFLWTNSSADTRALQEIGSSNRIAAAWYSPTSFTVNINFTDGLTHQLALYLLDWDGFGSGRNEQVQIIDATTGTVLNTQPVSNFSGGEYLVWNVSGDIQIKITNLNKNSNAVLNGLFIG